ncbi:MAG: Gfo/Idh/MocA family oxidoreductase [Proteobacteria bacterium]|nr:Gfo/Idh/MocA family oxidoreductase [Pseudomonadota bacterium]MYJ96038.1 Gfo/Idh/MocA family oxidoreductase [Pseudomonadota bacterium]
MTTLRAAVIGVGHLGRFHAQKYAALDGVELVAVCDVDRARARDVAAAHDTRPVFDHRELTGRVDAVTIAADTSAHFELARFFLVNGVHVLVEKPMTATSEEGRELTRIADRNDLRLQVGHVERFNPALLSARERLSSVQFIECHRLAPFRDRGADVNVVLDLMIHDLDLILSLLGSKPVRVSAVGIPVLTDTPDIASARIEFDSGAIANVTASRVSTAAQRKFRVFHEGHYLSIDFGEGEVQLVSRTESGAGPALREERWSLAKGDALLAEVESFCNAIRAHSPCEVSGHDGVLALEVAERIIADIQARSTRS